jgi:hypothetical protein
VTLLLTAGGTALALAVLAFGSLWRLLARRDHRCTVGSLRQGCAHCATIAEAADVRGGHVLCACGAVSPHLHGTALLAWRADHQGERFPGTPGPGPRLVLADEVEGELEDARALAAIEAEDESIRRAVVRARRSPDPRTPQVLREVARDDLGATDVNRG